MILVSARECRLSVRYDIISSHLCKLAFHRLIKSVDSSESQTANEIIIITTMKKGLGIIRNQTERLSSVKKEALRKKNRFQIVGKDDVDDYNTGTLTTTHSDPASLMELSEGTELATREALELFQQARGKIKKVTEMQKKMGELSKSRLTSLREKENQKYDESISKIANQATSNIVAAEGLMRKISKVEVSSSASRKILHSMQASLASEIQEISRSLRSQEKEYFQRVKTYEGTINSAIQLTAEQRRTMEGDWEELIEEQEDSSHHGKVGELAQSISKLSMLYKELSSLVVAQGTIIDRIDYNLEETEQHTANAVVNLQQADEHASSPFADKIIKTLVITIMILAVVLGLKYMK